MTTPVLECQNITKHYQQGPDTIEVLQRIDLRLNAGERLGIVGASGSGKSTLLNMLGGLDQPTSGEVRLGGEPFSSLNDNQRARIRNQQLGFVYQFHHLLGEFTALENVALPHMIGGHSRRLAQEKAHKLLKDVGLGHRINHKPSELSGGERQRVAIARALVNTPSCVLMDEPTGNLDRHNAQAVQELLQNLSTQLGIAFIVVTHDEQVAATMDSVWHLEDGQLTQQVEARASHV